VPNSKPARHSPRESDGNVPATTNTMVDLQKHDVAILTGSSVCAERARRLWITDVAAGQNQKQSRADER
jgi:hypothetical protein